MHSSLGFCAALLLATGLAGQAARAATPEDLYFTARDAAIAKVKAAVDAQKRGPTDGYDDRILAMEAAARADLERQMRGIVGPVAIQGLPGPGALNLDTLFEGDEGFGLLDGLVFGPADGKTRVIVTKDSLFGHWLREHRDWWRDERLPQDPGAVVRENAFYTQAVLTDSAILRFAEIPIHKPAQASFAFAMLAARTQSEVPPKADEIFLALRQGGRVFVAHSTEFPPVGPIAACDAIRDALVKQSLQAAENPALSKDERGKTSDALRGQSEAEFLRCFAGAASRQPGFAAAARAAQALADRLPAR